MINTHNWNKWQLTAENHLPAVGGRKLLTAGPHWVATKWAERLGAAKNTHHPPRPSGAAARAREGPRTLARVWASPSNCDVIGSWGWGSERGVLCLGDDSAGAGSVLQDGLTESFSPRQHYCRFRDESPYKERSCFFHTSSLLLLVQPSSGSGVGRLVGRKKIWVLAFSLLLDPDQTFDLLKLNL